MITDCCCATCHRPYPRHHHLQRYCSPGCEQQARARRDRERKRAARIALGLPVGPRRIICRHCQQPAIVTPPGQRRCHSPACAEATLRDRLARKQRSRQQRQRSAQQQQDALRRLLCSRWGRRTA